MALLEVRGLTTVLGRRSGEVPIIRDVALEVERGEALGLVGESGSGKSVTMLSVMGVIPSPPMRVTSGQVVLDGRDLVGLDEERMRRVRGVEMAMVYQDPMASLNPVMRIGRQITEGMIAHGTDRSAARHRALEVLAQVGIPDPRRIADSYPHELSGGMQQRVMIAMALALSPGLLIFDEPTTALDVTIQQQILYLVRRLQEETGVAVIWITHDLGVVARLVDRVSVMYGGRVVETAEVGTLFRRPLHPYTEALLAAVPVMHGHDRPPLSQIPGAPPEIDRFPIGCPFVSRCLHAVETCMAEIPSPVTVDGSLVACWAPRGGRP